MARIITWLPGAGCDLLSPGDSRDGGMGPAPDSLPSGQMQNHVGKANGRPSFLGICRNALQSLLHSGSRLNWHQLKLVISWLMRLAQCCV
eukprot:scaffold42033_cov37-Prasinocladus_malaysianus.AAC.1